MYVFLILLVTALPGVGILLMERGIWGTSVGVAGFPNGAFLNYLVYAQLLLLCWFLTYAYFRSLPIKPITPANPPRLRKLHVDLLLSAILVCNLLFFVIVLIAFGAWEVLAGLVQKGTFRMSLGGYGAAANLITRFFAPALMAFGMALVLLEGYTVRRALLLAANAAVVFAIGMSWGFKSTGVFMLIPAIILACWRVSLGALLKLGIAGAALIMLLAFYFDVGSGAVSSAEVLRYVVRRLTVSTGDVSWSVWQMLSDGHGFPDYLRTLTVFIGDRAFSAITGITRADQDLWVSYHFDMMLTHLMGNSFEIMASGHNITGTPFAEGVIALGKYGGAVFGVLAGVLIGAVHYLIWRALQQRRITAMVIWSCYATMSLIPWLMGGAVVQLFHVGTIVPMLMLAIGLPLAQRIFSSKVDNRSGLPPPAAGLVASATKPDLLRS